MMVTVWTSGTPGVLELPSGRRVRGGRVGHHPSPAPEHGLYLTWREPSTPWPSAWVRWPDFGLPLDGRAAREAIVKAWRLSPDRRVEVACRGGVGRTGTVLAAMCVLDGLDAPEAVAWVRSRYHPRAVETPWQAAWLARSG